MEEKEIMRMRCHFSIIFESLWQFWAVIVLILINQIDTIVDLVREIGTSGLKDFILSGGIWGLLAVVALTVVVLSLQFFRWRKTWVTLDDNLIIVERDTLKKVKNTITIENISAVNMERNLFERIVGTYRIKIDTNSLTTAGKTDISIVFGYEKAVAFRDAVLHKMKEVKGVEKAEKKAEKAETASQQTWKEPENGEVFRYKAKDMAAHCFYTASVFSLLITLGGIGLFIWYVNSYGFGQFVQVILGGAIAAALVVLGAAFSLIRKFITYYDFTVYRFGEELHLRYGLIKLRSYTIPVDKITCLEIQQPCFSRIFKRYEAKVITVGVGDEEGESSNLTMALPKEEFFRQLSVLLPEYCSDSLIEGMKKEEGKALVIKAAKFIKWTICFSLIALFLLWQTPVDGLYIGLGLGAILIFIGVLYLTAHITAGYKLEDGRAAFANGEFTKRIYICKYEKMQNIRLHMHPLGRPYHIVTGAIYLLNSTVGVPYMKEEQARRIEEEMIGKKKEIRFPA